MDAWYAVAIALLGVQRLAELLYSRHTARILVARGAVAIRPDGMTGIVAVHVLFFVCVIAESTWAPWAGVGGIPVLLAGGVLFAAGQLLRYASMIALRWRWNTRVFVVAGAPLVRTGPYRILRHPIYGGVVLELAGFALLNSLWVTAIGIAVLNLLALRQRIHIEQAAWSAPNPSSR